MKREVQSFPIPPDAPRRRFPGGDVSVEVPGSTTYEYTVTFYDDATYVLKVPAASGGGRPDAGDVAWRLRLFAEMIERYG